MLTVSDLSKKYGDKLAVNHIGFSIDKNGVIGFLGPNGAGKSTTMNMITGYISSSSGSVLVNGADILADPIQAKRQIGYLPEIPPLYRDLTVREYLNFVCGLKRFRGKRENEIDSVCEQVGITHVSNRLIGNLSKGYQQRVGIAQALIGDPEILILDEPTVGLDPSQIIEIRKLIRKLGETKTVILSTHILSEVQIMCSRIIMICEGKIVADGDIDTLESGVGGNKYSLEIEGIKEKILETLNDMACVDSVEYTNGMYEIFCRSGDDKEIRKTIAAGLKEYLVTRFERSTMTLEKMFIDLTARTDPLRDDTEEDEQHDAIMEEDVPE